MQLSPSRYEAVVSPGEDDAIAMARTYRFVEIGLASGALMSLAVFGYTAFSVATSLVATSMFVAGEIARARN